jgi:hypothetical protein
MAEHRLAGATREAAFAVFAGLIAPAGIESSCRAANDIFRRGHGLQIRTKTGAKAKKTT